MISAPVLVRAARFGVVEDLDPVFIEGEKIHEVLASARYDHLTGLLAAAVDHGVLVVDEPSRMLVRMAWQEELLACVVLESLAVRTAAVLDESEVRWRLTKGAALAHQDYPDPSLRTFGDVDVVVHPADWKRALDALARGGMQRFGADLGDEYDRRYGKGATLTSSDGYEVDLHRCFSVGRFGVTSQMEDAFAGAGSILLGGRVIPTLTPEFRLVHACHHAVLGGFQRLRAFRDVAQLLLLNDVDWLYAFDIAERWRSEAVIASAIIETWRRLELNVDHAALDAARCVVVSRGDRRALEIFASERSFRRQALTALPRLGVPEAARFIWILGSRAFVDSVRHRRSSDPLSAER